MTEKQQESGFIFLNKYGERITTRGISGQLKKLAVRYNINPVVVYPHSFRHRFAKSFLERCNDIAFLADLMGHESIETTRIYLRKTATEQREIVEHNRRLVKREGHTLRIVECMPCFTYLQPQERFRQSSERCVAVHQLVEWE